jgi:hypothetical protein
MIAGEGMGTMMIMGMSIVNSLPRKELCFFEALGNQDGNSGLRRARDGVQLERSGSPAEERRGKWEICA